MELPQGRYRTHIRGIYYLYKDDKLMYIGSSENILGRIGLHCKRKEIDSFSYMEVPEGYLIDIEYEEIAKHNPPLNKRLTYPKKDLLSETRRIRIKYLLRKYGKTLNIKKGIISIEDAEKLLSDGGLGEYKHLITCTNKDLHSLELKALGRTEYPVYNFKQLKNGNT